VNAIRTLAVLALVTVLGVSPAVARVVERIVALVGDDIILRSEVEDRAARTAGWRAGRAPP